MLMSAERNGVSCFGAMTMYDNSRVVDHGAVQPPCRVQGGVSPDYNLRLRQQEALLLWPT